MMTTFCVWRQGGAKCASRRLRDKLVIWDFSCQNCHHDSSSLLIEGIHQFEGSRECQYYCNQASDAPASLLDML
eukprot:scaffold260_cov115-Cylindrotheca_fusiformis.AAC.5